MRRFAITPVSVLLVVGLAPAPVPQAVAAHAPPAAAGHVQVFHPQACPDGLFGDLDVDCGYIRVPEDREQHRHGPQIRVAAAVVHSAAPTPGAEPILVLPGGPSFGAINDFYVTDYFADTTWDDGHDIVLVDTRGVGLSEPRLGCPEVDRAFVRHFYAEPSVGSHGVQIFGDALRACHRRLVREGVSPARFTVHESIGDLEYLRRALDVRRWNLLAISADGVLGLSYLRERPGSFRSVIVDSGLSPQVRGFLDYERGRHLELKRIIAGCAATPACRKRYPHVGRAFMRTVRRLNAHPQVITFPKFRPHPVRLRLDGAGLYIDTLNQIFPGDRVFPETIHEMLDFMWVTSHGALVRTYRRDFGRGPVTVDHLDDFLALGATMSWECQAVTSFVTLRDRRQAARAVPPFAARFLRRGFDLVDSFANVRSPAGCRVWNAGRAPAWQHLPVKSSVPALVLAGGMDNGVPRYIVKQVVPGLSRSTYVEFPASGHLQLAAANVASGCAREIAGQFLRHPLQKPDTSCVAGVPEFDFTPPAERGRPGVERFGGLDRWLTGPGGDVQVR